MEVIVIKHRNKMIAPIIIAAIFVIYFIFYFGLLMSLVGGIGKVLLGVIPLAFAAVMIKVCVERIKEINGGQEDDLSKY